MQLNKSLLNPHCVEDFIPSDTYDTEIRNQSCSQGTYSVVGQEYKEMGTNCHCILTEKCIIFGEVFRKNVMK